MGHQRTIYVNRQHSPVSVTDEGRHVVIVSPWDRRDRARPGEIFFVEGDRYASPEFSGPQGPLYPHSMELDTPGSVTLSDVESSEKRQRLENRSGQGATNEAAGFDAPLVRTHQTPQQNLQDPSEKLVHDDVSQPQIPSQPTQLPPVSLETAKERLSVAVQGAPPIITAAVDTADTSLMPPTNDPIDAKPPRRRIVRQRKPKTAREKAKPKKVKKKK